MTTKFVLTLFSITVFDLIVFLVCMGTMLVSAQSKCFQSGYPKADIDIHFKPYCINSLTAQPL
jgi:hypothetical protein